MKTEEPSLVSSTPEEAIHLLNIEDPTEEELEAAWQEYIQSPEGRSRLTTEEALSEIRRVLNQHGWYSDQSGDMDFMLFEVERNIMEYVERYPPIIELEGIG